jgi:hypothetical protein
MAGAGFKTFNTGDVLTASDVNLYLMQQTLMVFDDAAARTTALTGVVAEGMLSYLKDTNAVEVYDGSSWVASDDPNAIQNSIVDAKGDLISATADNTPARLAVGADNTVLTADSSTSTGLKWAAAAGGGKILQVVEGSTSTQATNNTSTYADTGLTASITPSAATSKILIICSQQGIYKSEANSNQELQIKLMRGATDLADYNQLYTGSAMRLTNSITFTYLDSPNTTSATTYKTQYRSASNNDIVYVQANTDRSSIILMEVGA